MNSADPDGPTARRSWPRRLLNRLEIDRAVFFALAVRGWQFVAGPVTMLLIASRFSQATQGYFYTFGSLIALQTFVELGLHSILINLTSHEWSRLRWDPERKSIEGDADALSRLRSLLILVAKWYGVSATAFVLLAGTAGTAFFSQEQASGVNWLFPWWAVVACSGLSLWLMPGITMLEGCGQVVVVNKYRLALAVCGNIAVWSSILLDLNLWTLAAAALVKLVGELVLVGVRYGGFFGALLRSPRGVQMNWRRDVWPLQSRVAVQALFIYFYNALFNPILFHYRGPIEAGQFGMSWNVLVVIQSAALTWLQARVPLFGLLVANRQFAELDRVWKRVTAVSLGILTAAGGVFLVAVWMINSPGLVALVPSEAVRSLMTRLADRMLPLSTAAVFLAGVILMHVPTCEALYVRAHRIEPFTRLSVIGYTLVGLLAWFLGSRYGAIGAGVAYVGVAAGVFLPGFTSLWQACRKRHQTGGTPAPDRVSPGGLNGDPEHGDPPHTPAGA